MRSLSLNSRSSSASTALKVFASKHGIDLSRFRTGRRDLDLTGKLFGALTVLGPAAQKKTGLRRWRCKCVCGTEVVDTTGALCAGYRHHCGCASYPRGNQSRRWRGHGEIPGRLWHQFKRNARTRGLVFTVTPAYVWNLFLNAGKKCVLSGVPLSFDLADVTASLDRIDSELGYVEGNVQWTHKSVNVMKHGMVQKEFVEWACRIAKVHENESSSQRAGA